MNKFLQSLFTGFFKQIAYQYAFKQLKRKAVLTYLKTLQVMRKSLLLALFVFLTLQLMIFGFLGLVITSIWLIPTSELNTKLYMLLGFFGFLFMIPAIGLGIILSERFWFKISGAEEMIKESAS